MGIIDSLNKTNAAWATGASVSITLGNGDADIDIAALNAFVDTGKGELSLNAKTQDFLFVDSGDTGHDTINAEVGGTAIFNLHNGGSDIALSANEAAIVADNCCHNIAATTEGDIILNLGDCCQDNLVISAGGAASVVTGDGNINLGIEAGAIGGGYAATVGIASLGVGMAQYAGIQSGNGEHLIQAMSDRDISVSVGDGDLGLDAEALGSISVKAENGDKAISAIAGEDIQIEAGDGDSYIDAGSLGNTVVTLGNGDASIVVSANEASVEKLDGDLEILADTDGRFFLKSGKGDSFVDITSGDYTQVELGNGDSDVTIDTAGNAVMTIGDGASKVNVTANAASLDSGFGSLDLTAKTTGDFYLEKENGETKINIDAGQRADVRLGTGESTMDIKADHAYITTGDGDKDIKADVKDWIYLQTGENGEDTVDVKAGGDAELYLGFGNSDVTLEANNAIIKTDCGDQTIKATTKEDLLIETGHCGIDKITADAKGNASITTSDGDDIIDLTVGKSFYVNAGSDDETYYTDNDTVRVKGNLEYKTEDNTFTSAVILGKGNDDVRVIGNDVQYRKDTGNLELGFFGNNSQLISDASNNKIGFWGDDATMIIKGVGKQDIKTLDFSFEKGEFKDFGFEELVNNRRTYVGSSIDTITTTKLTGENNLDEVAAQYNLTAAQTELLKSLDLTKTTETGNPYYLLYKDSEDKYQIGYRDNDGNTYDMSGNKLNYETSSEEYVLDKDGNKLAYSDPSVTGSISQRKWTELLEREYKDGSKGTGHQEHRDTVYTDKEGQTLTGVTDINIEQEVEQKTTTIKTDYYKLGGVKNTEIHFLEDGIYDVSLTAEHDIRNGQSIQDVIITGKNSLNGEKAKITVRGGIITTNISESEDSKKWGEKLSLSSGNLELTQWTDDRVTDWIYDDPIILDTNKDGSVDAAKDGTGVDIDGDGKADGSATNGDKMLAMSDLNGNGKIDGTEVFGNKTISPFSKKELNAENGFEALKMIALEAEELGYDCIEGDYVNIEKLSAALEKEANIKIGLISGSNTTTLESADDIKYVSISYATAADNGKAIQHKQVGSYIDAQGSTYNAHDVWYRQ